MKISSIVFRQAFLISLLLVSCNAKSNFEILNLRIQTNRNVIKLKTECALSEKQKQQGFMHRNNIPYGTGMLFIYKSDQQMSFWMKNTPTALSIAFVSANGIIREIYDMKAFSTAVIKSKHSVRFALEVPQGWFECVGINIGDRVLDLAQF